MSLLVIAIGLVVFTSYGAKVADGAKEIPVEGAIPIETERLKETSKKYPEALAVVLKAMKSRGYKKPPDTKVDLIHKTKYRNGDKGLKAFFEDIGTSRYCVLEFSTTKDNKISKFDMDLCWTLKKKKLNS